MKSCDNLCKIALIETRTIRNINQWVDEEEMKHLQHGSIYGAVEVKKDELISMMPRGVKFFEKVSIFHWCQRGRIKNEEWRNKKCWIDYEC